MIDWETPVLTGLFTGIGVGLANYIHDRYIYKRLDKMLGGKENGNDKRRGNRIPRKKEENKREEDIQEESILMFGESHYETELYRNREFAIAILDRAMNCCDIDEDNATRFDRLQQVEKMIEALKECKDTLWLTY